ncbi:hypothetical protein E2C01_092141 [Portunus trituberculatus]|uniref:Uncharacterized protein n=1 Tax=Portunus trituberculatus TaxID=210409 RepID=A0A5B7JKU0_PORTR|nr:hypothetical protein [Portunus trituberculatus]
MLADKEPSARLRYRPCLSPCPCCSLLALTWVRLAAVAAVVAVVVGNRYSDGGG